MTEDEMDTCRIFDITHDELLASQNGKETNISTIKDGDSNET